MPSRAHPPRPPPSCPDIPQLPSSRCTDGQRKTKNPSKTEKPPKFSIHPKLHDDVARQLADADLHFSFRDDRSDTHSINAYNSSVIAFFICYNNRCPSRSWVSGKVAIRILLYEGQQYHARVYHQRCEQCNMVCKPRLNGTYAERVVRRLKIWSGVRVEGLPHRGRSTTPHLSEFCEGCRAGFCMNA